MSCLRCGRETAENQVFCKLCLEDMEKYPVKPGTTVQIPSQAARDALRKPRAKQSSLQEEYDKLHHTVRILLLVLAVLLMGFAITAGLLINYTSQPQQESTPPEQNFGTAQTSYLLTRD